MNTDDFMRGQRDCQEGKPAQKGASPDYYRGYGSQYEQEQAITWFRMRGMKA